LVATVAHQTVAERERSVLMASNLVTAILRADGAVLTKSGGGAPHIDMAEVAHSLEQLGVHTALISWELSGIEEGAEGAALFNYPELDAVANVGCNDFKLSLPPTERAITLPDRPELHQRLLGPMEVRTLSCVGMMDQLGGGQLVAIRY